MKRTWLLYLVALTALVPRNAAAQDSIGAFLKDTAKDIVLDPTTYAPAGVSYLAHKLDWESSQVFFSHGFLEDNPDFTINGLPHDIPIGHAAGNRKIVRMALPILELSLINNVAVGVSERALTHFYPNHPKLIRVVGWVEKIAMAGYLSYQYSCNNFHQWRMNERDANQLGY